MNKTEIEEVLRTMKHNERRVWQTRKFLLGLSHSDTLPNSTDENCMPESLLRNDDLFYEDLKKRVELRYGFKNGNVDLGTVHGHIEFHSIRHMIDVISDLRDSLSNDGLYHLAKIVTKGSSVTFEKTRPQMRKVIKESLEHLQNNPCSGNQVNILPQVVKLVTNPKNFRWNQIEHLDVTLKSHRGAIVKVLDGLESMPTHTLNAIYRKLKGSSGYMPQFNPPRSGWNRDRLMIQIRNLCLKMMGQLGEFDKLQEPLAKAMAVAGLSLKLRSGYEDFSPIKFVYVSSEIEALQNDLFKAIQLLHERINMEDIKKLQRVLDPESVLNGKGVKAAVKNMLIEYLFESSDMHVIPDSLYKALTLINSTSANRRRFSTKDLIEEEVENILILSASIRQVLLDRLPGENIDQDFADAYTMEELEDSDDGDIFDEDDEELELDTMYEARNIFNDFNEEVQSNGDPDEACPNSSQGNPHVFQECGDDMETHGPAENMYKNKKAKENREKHRNQYLILQKVSDEASLIVYQLIGLMMEGFARKEGFSLSCDDVAFLTGELPRSEHVQDSGASSKGKGVTGVDRAEVLTKAVRKVIPSFSGRDLKKLKKFMKS